LATDIQQGAVTVYEDPTSVSVRLRGVAMFASGSEVVDPGYLPIILRVGEALNAEPGSVIVAGHSDNIPPSRASRWQSNAHLSLARAQSVMDIMAGVLTDTNRLTAEGRGDREPIASNDSREGRAQNRRIEVILVK
jgi:type VI secretion system protein ImpK